MGKLTGLAGLVGIIGSGALIPAGWGYAQVDGAIQYPPASVGKDAQPPRPAGMVPQTVSPRRIELGVSGSSQPPAGFPSSSRLWPDTDRHAPSLGSWSASISSAGRN
jgi:hypothetical protein